MNEEKKNILAKLYTLRAGMAAISVRKDKVDQSKETIANKQKNYAERVGKINNQLSSNKINMQTQEYRLENKPSVWKSILFIFLAVLVAGTLIVLGWLFWKYVIQTGRLLAIWNAYWKGDWFINGWQKIFHSEDYRGIWDYIINFIGSILSFFVIIIGFILAIALILGIIVGAPFLVFKLFQWSGESISDFRYEKYNHQKAPQQMQALQQSNQRLKTEYQKITKETKDDVIEENKLIEQNVKAGGVLYKTLYEQYKDFLDVRDWQNVDLLIFYFETGRADTMKEALQQVDHDRRFADLGKLIMNASEQICRTINVRMDELQSNNTNCFSRLFEGLTLMHQSIVSQIQTGQEIEKLQLQALTKELGDAVKQKKNQSSSGLADDVHYLKIMAENAEIRRRNNV